MIDGERTRLDGPWARVAWTRVKGETGSGSVSGPMSVLDSPSGAVGRRLGAKTSVKGKLLRVYWGCLVGECHLNTLMQ